MDDSTNDQTRITILHHSATLSGLRDQGTPAHPRSEPPCRLSGIDVTLSGAGDNACGIWECTPGRFLRQLAEAEVMHVLTGRGRFTPTHGEPIEFGAGDTLFFPAYTTGEWQIEEALRKVFVVMAAH
ncbi:MAG TPA: cupin domain-containing protein [Burkholderiaceae bacterium]|nr:cupin domain-containing protein [Burkholderiaceae bacterium]